MVALFSQDVSFLVVFKTRLVFLVQTGACVCLIHGQLKLFHSELLAQLEQKLELDIKYLTVRSHRWKRTPCVLQPISD